MKIINYLSIVLFIIFTISLEAKDETKKKRIIVSKTSKDNYRMRIYLNAENPYSSQLLLTAKEARISTTLPIADRFEVLKMKQFVKYKTSLSMNNKASFISMKMNQSFVKQFLLVGKIGDVESVESEIPISLLKEGYNQVCIEVSQEPTTLANGSRPPPPPPAKDISPTGKIILECVSMGSYSAGSSGGATNPTGAWTQINTEESFIEFDFRLKPFKEKVNSIYKFMFDNKNMTKDKINFIFPEIPTEDNFINYGFMANIIGYILKFKDIDFSISTELRKDLNNVVISNRKNLENVFSEYNMTKIADKLSGNINLIQNQDNDSKGILVITGDSQKEIYSSIMKLADEDIIKIESQNISVKERELPQKMRPFTAPKFVELGEKITFKDLGIKTNTYSGITEYFIYGEFKLYPTTKFREGIDFIETQLNYISSDSSLLRPVFNIFLNNNFTHQISGKENLSDSKNELFMTSEKNKFTSISLKSGLNIFNYRLTIYPRGDKICGINTIQVTLRDDSYVILPKGKTEIEFPNLKYISDMAFPFSIYPDLQNTGILITDFNADTIASAMQIAFQLGKKIDYPAYHLITTYNINNVLDKDIIVLGSQIERYEILYSNAPIKLTDTGWVKEKVVEIDGEKSFVKREELLNLEDYIIAQTYQSPFNPKRIIFDISAIKPQTLLMGVQDGLNPQNIGQFDGDVWIYNTDREKSQSYRFKDTYILDEIVDGYRNKFSDKIYQDIESF